LERVARRASQWWGERQSSISASTHLLMELNQHLENVQAIYERIVRAQRPLYYTPSNGNTVLGEPPVEGTLSAEGKMNKELLQAFRDAAPELSNRVLAEHGHGLTNGM